MSNSRNLHQNLGQVWYAEWSINYGPSLKYVEKKKLLGHNNKDISLKKICCCSHLSEMVV